MSTTTTSTTVSTTLPAGTWQLDPAHSRVEFALDYMGGTFRGTFQPFEAELHVSEDGSEDGGASLNGRARAESVQVNDENLSAHLLSPDFFDAERAPELSFSSNDLRREGDTIVVEGELAIRGVSKPVTLEGTIAGPLTDGFGRERVTLTLSGKVDRTAFGIEWNMPLPSGEQALQNEVDLSAQLYFIKAA